jgi:hypothetical protein
MNEGRLEESIDNNGSRPRANFILGVISVLEPSLTEMLPLFCQLNADEDKVIETLGLNFDPEQELSKKNT